MRHVPALLFEIIKMAKFEVVQVPEMPFARRWTIEEIVPGEGPNPVPFFGRKPEAEAEAHRLNLFGRSATALGRQAR